MLTLASLRELLSLFAGLVVVASLAYGFVRSAHFAMWALAVIVVSSQAVVPALTLQVTAAGITFYALDIVTGLMLVIGVVRLATQRVAPSVFLPMTALAGFFTIHVVWGVVDFGMQAAVNDARDWLYFLGPLVFAAQATPQLTRRSFIPLFAAAAALASFGLFRIARYGLYAANTVIDVNGHLTDARPVTAAGALLLLQCVLIASSARFVRSFASWLLVALMAVAVVLLQIRTVWIIAVVIAASGYVNWARSAIFVKKRAALGAASVLLLLSPLAVATVASSSVFAESARSATGNQSTLSWRTQSWSALIGDHHSAQVFLVGLPAGTSLARVINNEVATQSAHSLYVDGFLSLGIFGPALLVWLWVVLVRRRHVVAAVLGVSGPAVALILASNALFGLTDMLGAFQGLLIGVLVQAAYPRNGPDPGSTERGIRPSAVEPAIA